MIFLEVLDILIVSHITLLSLAWASAPQHAVLSYNSSPNIFESCELNGQHGKTFLNIEHIFQHYKADGLPFPALVPPRITGSGL